MNSQKQNDTLMRVLVAILGIPLIVLAILSDGIYFFIFVFLLNGLCTYELLRLFEKKNIYPFKILSIVFSSAALIFYAIDFKYSIISLILSFMIVATAEIFRNEKIRNPLSPAVTLFAFVYISVTMLMLLNLESDSHLLLAIVVMMWSNDTGAYFTGRAIGKHKLTPVSPNKTVEGFIGGIVLTFIVGFLIYHFKLIDMDIKSLAIYTFIVSFVGTAGDLFESLIKRYVGVKDSSHIIPGHGGLLDRFDSFMFIIPALFIYIKFIKLIL